MGNKTVSTNKSNRSVVITLIAGVLLLVLAIIFYSFSSSPNRDELRAESMQTDEDSTAGAITTQIKRKTIGSQWALSEDGNSVMGPNKNTNPSGSASNQNTMSEQYPFTAESVYNALQAVKVDEQGNIILDNDAMIALDEALERIYNQLSPQALAALQQLIRDALPGITGEQTAELVADYAEYLKAKEAFSAMHEGDNDDAFSNDGSDNTHTDSAQAEIAKINDDAALYEELQALRTVHLGDEAATELFRVSDAAANYMFESMKLTMQTDVPREQLVQEQQRLYDQQISQALNIEDWDSRYALFKSNKDSIVNSSLSQSEKDRQVMQLIQQQFNAEEIEKMRYFGLEQAY